ncbi:MAG: hypothetical protein M3O71_30185 [Bacteroidota bacterium]|nr:hypothetical protein [Bacteroidota bacterium]
MKRLFLIFSLAAVVLNIAACDNHNPKDSNSNKEVKKAIKYYCPMHPSVTFDKPGTCPKCGMELVAKDTTKGG